MHDLSGKVALVTGASSGFGARFTRLLATSGVRVAATARRLDRLEALAAELHGAGAEVVPVAMDVTDPVSIATATETAQRLLGPIGILVNNAGIGLAGRMTDTGVEAFDRVFATNVRGAFLVAQAVARRMIDAKVEGRIVNIASAAGLRPFPGLGVYGMTKAALIQMTRSLAKELARDGINVNAICPGYIRTELNAAFFDQEAGRRTVAGLPRGRLGEIEDLDGLLLLLASGASRLITGQAIAVDDGFSAV